MATQNYSKTRPIWRLKKGADRRLRSGHPWVFASELNHSAREIAAGELVELRDWQEHFLAWGYAHPSSQIAFRKLSGVARESDVFSVEFFVRRLRSAREHRKASGWSRFSHRWFYAEADGIPGLVIDAFLTTREGWWVVVQASTAGVERALPNLFEALRTFEHEFGLLSVIESPSSKARALEGLDVGAKRLVFGGASDLSKATICLSGDLKLECDIEHGQKTGFFLDQQWNAMLLRQSLRSRYPKGSTEAPLRVLDICCYVGQWAAHVARELRGLEHEVSVTLLDASQAALAQAEANLRGLADEVHVVCGDALEGLPDGEFDIVICDPPAFVKKKADLAAGARAYVKLNREAMRRLKPGGVYVASSCSGLVKTEDWREILSESATKSGRTMRQMHAGGHGPDHPLKPQFPEGEYLKCGIYLSEASTL